MNKFSCTLTVGTIPVMHYDEKDGRYACDFMGIIKNTDISPTIIHMTAYDEMAFFIVNCIKKSNTIQVLDACLKNDGNTLLAVIKELALVNPPQLKQPIH